MTFTTAGLCDAYCELPHLQIAEPLFKHYGANTSFRGRISTLKVFEDSLMIQSLLEEKVNDRVLVIDGGGSHRCALVDVKLARIAVDHGWRGIIIYGCIRDSAQLAELPIGIRALHAHPLKCHNKHHGDRDQSVNFAGVNFKKDHYLYADADGIIVSGSMLS